MIVITAIQAALAQMPDPRFMRVLLRALALTLGVFGAIYICVGVLVSFIGPITLPWIGAVEIAGILTGLAIGAMIFASAFLMIPVASVCIGFFVDDVARAVEDHHYTGLPAPRKIGIWETVGDALSFFGVLIVANLFALIVYLIAIPFAPLVFYGLNGLLLGREYFQLVALRRVDAKEAKRLRRAHFGTIWLAGVLMALPLTIPIMNLFIPIIGAATFTHLFHRVSRV